MRIRIISILLIATMLSTLLAGFWWMTRPVIDPRLVGTWGIAEAHAEPWPLLIFRSDGSGERKSYPWPVYIPPVTGQFRWHPQGEALLIEFGRGPAMLTMLPDRLRSWIGLRQGRSERWRVDEVSNAKLRLRDPNDQLELVRIRVPD